MRTISLDLTPLQGPHRMRGVGYVVINFIKNISEQQKKDNRFVLYVYEKDHLSVLDVAGIDSTYNYEIRLVKKSNFVPKSIRTPKGLLQIPVRAYKNIESQLGFNHRLGEMNDIDMHLQFEQDILPPAKRKVKTAVIAYDLIPYILEQDYLWSYSTARHRHHYSRRGALLAQLRRMRYLSNIRHVMNRSHKVIAISDHTKKDFIKLANVAAHKITTIHLGVSDATKSGTLSTHKIDRYIDSSWGDVKVKDSLPTEPFLLFIGGADPRRRIGDLVASYNILRAQGKEVSLVLAGDTMFGPNSVPNVEAARAIQSSSYKENIYFLGFVSDAVREWLYQNALAFVYPSRYEGFGLPVLEAMRYGTPVITYDNSSIREIAEGAALYADEYNHIANYCLRLLSDKKYIEDVKAKSSLQAHKFTWIDTVNSIFANL